MSRSFLIALLFVTSSLTQYSCTEDDDSIDLLVGTYVGAMNVSTPSFSNAQYSVVVSNIGSGRVRITPSGSAGTVWQAALSNVAGVYTCITCVAQDQITFTLISGRYQLVYNYSNNNEQFAGIKQ